MPIVSTFYGITIRMYHGDHPPPHIHAEYQGHRALVAIADGAIIAGKLPRQAARLVKEWCQTHQDELLADWTLAQAFEPLRLIAGADQD